MTSKDLCVRLGQNINVAGLIETIDPRDSVTGGAGIKMHPLRKLRESGKATLAQISQLLAENIVFNSPILARPIQGRELIALIFTQSSNTRGSGTYAAEFKLDERTTFMRWVGTMDGQSSRAWRSSWTTSTADCGTHYCPPAVSGSETVPRRHVCSAQG